MKPIRLNKETKIQETYNRIPHNILEEIKLILKTSVHYLIRKQGNLEFKLLNAPIRVSKESVEKGIWRFLPNQIHL